MLMLKESIDKCQIDILMMNETNTRWNSINVSRMESKMKSIDRENCVVVADSKEWDATPNDYLPGRLCSVFFSESIPLVDSKKVAKGRLGN